MLQRRDSALSSGLTQPSMHVASQQAVMVLEQYLHCAGDITCSLVIPIHTAPPSGARATGHFQMWLAPSYRRSFPSSQSVTYPRPDVLHEVWPVQQTRSEAACGY